MFPADEQLQQERRAVDHLAPPALVFRFRDPCLPETRCLMESLLNEVHLGFLPSGTNSTKNECCLFSSSQAELCHCTFGVLFQGNCGVQREWRTCVIGRGENRTSIFNLLGVLTSRIVKSRL